MTKRARLSTRASVTMCLLAVVALAPQALWTATSQAEPPQLVDRAVAAGIIYPGSPLASTPSWDATVVDYDDDGDQDFHVVLHMKYEGMLFRNNGDGTFTRVLFVPGSLLETITPRVNQKGEYIDRHACTWGDPNNDGQMDLYCSAGRWASNKVKTANIDNELFLLNPGSTTFADRAVQAGVREPCGRGRFTTFIDVNGDGWDDLFVGNQRERNDTQDPCNTYGSSFPAAEQYPVSEKSKLYINAGQGPDGSWAGFRFDQRWNTIGASATAVGFQNSAGQRCAEPWDYNRDGRVDLLGCMFDNQRPYLYRNDGSYFTEVSRLSSVNLAALNALTIGDLNADGIDDFVFSNNSGFFYRLGTSSGISPSTVRVGATLPSGTKGWAVALGDINGDGLMDLYGQTGSANESGNPDDYVYVQQSDGSFSTLVAPSAGGRADDVEAVRVGNRDAFLVLNGKLEDPVPGPVQCITWAAQ